MLSIIHDLSPLEPIPNDNRREVGTPWTGHQFITVLRYRDKQLYTLTFSPTGNLESLNTPTGMASEYRRKFTQRT